MCIDFNATTCTPVLRSWSDCRSQGPEIHQYDVIACTITSPHASIPASTRGTSQELLDKCVDGQFTHCIQTVGCLIPHGEPPMRVLVPVPVSMHACMHICSLQSSHTSLPVYLAPDPVVRNIPFTYNARPPLPSCLFKRKHGKSKTSTVKSTKSETGCILCCSTLT